MIRFGVYFSVIACICGSSLANTWPPLLSGWQLIGPDKLEAKLTLDWQFYELEQPLFSDYAQKLRAIRLPKQGKIRLLANGQLELPVGTVLAKTFYYPIKNNSVLLQPPQNQQQVLKSSHQLIETRMLLRKASGWEGVSYQWQLDQNDAQVKAVGATVKLHSSQQSFNYEIPNQNQCRNCHEIQGQMQPLGLKQLQLSNQRIQQWYDMGLLDKTSWPNWPQPNPRIEAARLYLDVNCGHCHQAGGLAAASMLKLTASTPLGIQLGLCKPPVAAGSGSGSLSFDIVPGKPEHSILWYRMNAFRPEIRMPEQGRSLIDTDGIQLIANWIRSLPSNCPPE